MLKTPQPIPMVRFFDPAIRHSDSNWQEYVFTRDLSHLAYHEGRTPVTFLMRPLSVRAVNAITASGATETAQSQRNEAAFRRSLVGIQNPKMRHDTSQRVGDLWRPQKVVETEGDVATGDVIVSFDELEAFWPAEVQELGQAIYEMSFLDVGSGMRLSLPPSCLPIVAELGNLLAGRTSE